MALAATGVRAAIAAAERLRQWVAKIELRDPVNGTPVGMTISCGVADFPAAAESRGRLIEKADAAMLDAKRHGRDQVIYHKASRSA